MGEFKKACKDYRIGLSEEEIKAVFNHFDKRGDGTIDYEEFLREIRVIIYIQIFINIYQLQPPLNEFRLNLILQAFDVLDKNGNGTIEMDDIAGVYNAKMHPEVKSGRKSEDDILNEFLETFEQHHNYMVFILIFIILFRIMKLQIMLSHLMNGLNIIQMCLCQLMMMPILKL